MNRQEAARIVAVIIAACPSQGIKLDVPRTNSMIDTFTALLGDVTYEQANAAVTVLLQTRSWMPSVADIRSTALEMSRGPAAPGAQAWGAVLRAIQAEGAYRAPGSDFVFSDPVTARCVAALGWRELCLSENTVADRARFIEMYDKLAAQDQREQQAPMLSAARQQRELESGATNLISMTARRLAGGKP